MTTTQKDQTTQGAVPPARGKQNTGTIRWRGDRADVRLSLGAPHGRRTFALAVAITTEAQAAARGALLADLAARLRAVNRVTLALPLLERLAVAEGARDVQVTTKAIEVVIAGDTVALPTSAMTFGELATRWTSGELARLYPDHERPKRTADKDAQRFASYLRDIIGAVPLASFTLDHAKHAMRQLPPHLAPATRRQVAQIIRRVLALAVFPVCAIEKNPIPPDFLPRTGDRKAMTYLYPDEDAALLACTKVPPDVARAVPLPFRLLYGFLAREGMRVGEALALKWADVDFTRGMVTLVKNKTNDPRAWALRPDVLRALRAWRTWQKGRGILGSLVFVDEQGRPLRVRSEQLQAHLRAAGVERAALFERDEDRQPLRVHDLRAGFITTALANGETETWVQDRTGHKSSIMINRYRRMARAAEQVAMGNFSPLDTAIPELATLAAAPPAAGPPLVQTRANGREPSPEAPEAPEERRLVTYPDAQDALKIPVSAVRFRPWAQTLHHASRARPLAALQRGRFGVDGFPF